ncbi:hypothetical protein HYH02_010512 [Chlamydomonas schloesseri]|uniref:RRM domain-containing protein n=1 Tax=Chlamydomonas schloesseri TaxID=2026947 RepID=A0A835T6L9_9CHLO|nr:hypothetical protein HYH02_010512 [Chlamydomonas schloesseri]|eukprot:KAG2439882.1 hypothetical protein HYH02_010512 [Chlamydomonas schloesseri]
MFSQFGRVLDVVAMKTFRLRGQAWVVFTDTAAATNALRTMQGFPFFDKPIRITYAKTKSDAVAKVDGTYKPDKKSRQQKNAAAREAMLKRPAGNKPLPVSAGPVPSAAASAASGAANAPNKILFVQNLPESSNEAMLGMLFQQFPGFREVRMVEARPGIAFVEYENEMQSGTAMQGLQGFKITPTNAMNITFAKQ